MSDYAREKRIAELAVRRATILTHAVYTSRVKGTVTKDDKSPVTIGDYGAQALIIGAVAHAFPGDEIVGEETAETLREDGTLRGLVWGLVKSTTNQDKASEAEIGAIGGEEEMLTMIDRGNSTGGPSGRIWALDPIDGTKGFLRGDQYAVCLGLIVDGQVKVGVLGCPNLPADRLDPSGEKGILVSATKGKGATIKRLRGSEEEPISMRQLTDTAEASFCEGVEAGHSSHAQQAAVAARLGITKPSVRLDSQAKYASIARGDGDIYLRLPTSKSYEEKIWDHAAGSLIVAEAGGIISDAMGEPLDFSVGRTLKNNKGVVAASKGLFQKVIGAVKDELKASL